MSGRLLIVDEVSTNRLVLKVKLSSARYNVLMAEGANEAFQICVKQQPDLVIMDITLAERDGYGLCKAIKGNPLTSDIPIILLSALQDPKARLEGLKAGADDYMAKPIAEVALLARVRSLLRSRDQARELRLREATCSELGFAEEAPAFTPPADIRLIGPDLETARAWADHLGTYSSDRIAVADADSTLISESRDEKAPDLFVIAIDLRDKNEGLRLMADLRSRASTRHAAVIVVLPATDSERAATALDLGASDICYAPLDPKELAVRIKSQLVRKRRADRLRETLDAGLKLAVTDPLTGLYNRRYGLRHLQKVAQRGVLTGQPAAIILVDLDHFKALNDRFGHLNGDAVLNHVAERIRENLRSEDLVCRIGGEEFLVVLPETTLPKARLVAERLREAVALSTVTSDAGEQMRITLSLGLGELSSFDFDPRKTLSEVDKALYAAKRHGRNRFCIAEAPQKPPLSASLPIPKNTTA